MSDTTDEFAKIVATMTAAQKKRLMESLPIAAQKMMAEDAVAEKQDRQDQLHAAYKQELNQVIRAGARWRATAIRLKYEKMGYIARDMSWEEQQEVNNTR